MVAAADKTFRALWPEVGGARLLLQQHAALLQYEAPDDGSRDVGAGPARWPIAARHAADEVKYAVLDANALFVEKHGVAPTVEVLSDNQRFR